MTSLQNISILNNFLKFFNISSSLNETMLLEAVVKSFSKLPYENLTKIICKAEEGTPQRARRNPQRVLGDHFDFGTGGTCFSLTSTLLCLIRSLGWQAEPILADRPYGPNTHCALLIWIEGKPHLLDPGFLILKPVFVGFEEDLCLETSFNQMILSSHDNRLNLATLEKGQKKLRMTYKLNPVEKSEFLKVWDESFDWEMMRYPLLTKIVENHQIYLRKTRLQNRFANEAHHYELAETELLKKISQEFKIAPIIVSKALNILKTQGELCG